MKKNIDFNALQQCINELDTEDGFEMFDEIYDSIEEGNSVFEIKDIPKLCLLLKKPSELMEPHQFIKIEKMTYFTINEYDKYEGFDLLLKGLEQIIDYNLIETQGYLKMLIRSYKTEEIGIVSQLIKEYDREFRQKVYGLIKKIVRINPPLYEEKANIILENDID